MHIKISEKDLLESFPWKIYPRIRNVQKEALEIIPNGSAIFEAPTGSGKTAIGMTFLKALLQKGARTVIYATITKAQASQIKAWFPEVKVVFGRNEYRCSFYQGKVTAEDAPCTVLDCPHRIDDSGQTKEPDVEPCSYLQARYEANQGGIIVCTVAFYLLVKLFAKNKEWKTVDGLVFEEAHRVARMARNCLKWEITDYHLKRNIELLERIDVDEALVLKKFLRKMMRIVKKRKDLGPTLLEDEEIQALLEELLDIDSQKLLNKVKEAVEKRLIDPVEERETLKKLETIAHEIPRYVRAFEYSLETEERKPLSFTYGFYVKTLSPRQRVQYKLVVQSYYVAPIIRKISSPYTLAYSATIGDPNVFAFETGIDAPFHSFASEFPVKNTRIFLPTDTPNLSFRMRRKRDPQKALRIIAEKCRYLASHGIRSLVIVISEFERERFLNCCQRLEVDCISYGNGIKPREAIEAFKEGKAKVLVGTAANFGEGIDLPKQLAPAIFFLRPGYPRPRDPSAEFEKRRFGESMCWKLWNWRVMIEALQVRGRNVRSARDLGVTFFISQQFRNFLYSSLPEWLKDAYNGKQTLDDTVKETVQLVEQE